jgi:hypothetical protein
VWRFCILWPEKHHNPSGCVGYFREARRRPFDLQQMSVTIARIAGDSNGSLQVNHNLGLTMRPSAT